MCSNTDCLTWRNLLKVQQFQLAGWTITTRERNLHGNRLEVTARFSNQNFVIYPPQPIMDIVDDCNGDQYFEFLKWIADHPIKTGQEYQLIEITPSLGTPTTTDKYFAINLSQ